MRVDRDGPVHGRIAVGSDHAGIWLELHQVALAAFRDGTLETPPDRRRISLPRVDRFIAMP